MHREYTQLMSLVLDGEATPAEAQRLREHLDACGACSETWRQWRAIDRRFAATPALAAPVGLAERVIAGLETVELRRRRARWLGAGLLVGWMSFAVVAAVVASLAVVWFQSNTAYIVSRAVFVAHWIGALLLLAHGAVAAGASLGAPALAGAVGLLACATCVLGATWLRLLAQRGQLLGAAIPAAR